MPTEPVTCPWAGLEPAAMQFCEAEVCGWIAQPANTWSNLAYIVMGAWLIWMALRDGHRSLVAIGLIEILVGIGSFFFHMSGTHIGEVVDVGAMYLLSAYVLVTNFGRYRWLQGKPLAASTAAVLFVGLVGASVATIAAFRGTVGVILFAAQAILGGHLEVRLHRAAPDRADYRPLVGLLLCFAVAWTFWWLDLLRVVCSPDNHWLQGHALWHLCNSFVFYFLYRFYAGVRGAKRPGDDMARAPTRAA